VICTHADYRSLTGYHSLRRNAAPNLDAWRCVPMFSRYIGRFAPSPTGPLHFGSLIAAVGSYLQARTQGGLWRVRIDDLDPPREEPGAAAHILRTLDVYGLHWDGDVMYQSRRVLVYKAALNDLISAGHAYYCGCTRKQIEAIARFGNYGPIYPGICRKRIAAGDRDGSLRVLTHDQPIGFFDEHRGYIIQKLESEVGDFIVYRADGNVAYHLAAVVDDAEQGITQVVRGADLLESTPRQIYLQRLLRLPTPTYLHLPIAIHESGQKLSKQTRARPISLTNPKPYLVAALKFLNHLPPAEVGASSLDELWSWAFGHWSPARIPYLREIKPTSPQL
jgi:glutamyl-Q tRNA(Asp) synthetase